MRHASKIEIVKSQTYSDKGAMTHACRSQTNGRRRAIVNYCANRRHLNNRNEQPAHFLMKTRGQKRAT